MARRAGRPVDRPAVDRTVLRAELLRGRVRLMPARLAVPPAAAKPILPAAIHRPLAVLRARTHPRVTLAQVRITPRLPQWDRARRLRHTLPPRRLRSPGREVFSRSFAILSTGPSRSRPSLTFGRRFARAKVARSLRPSHQSRRRRSWIAICDAPSAKAKRALVLREKFRERTGDASPRPRITPGARRGNPGTEERARLPLINVRRTHTGMEDPAWRARPTARPLTPAQPHWRTRCERLKSKCKTPARIIPPRRSAAGRNRTTTGRSSVTGC